MAWPGLWGWLRLEQGELVEGEASAARGPLPRAAGPHRISNTHGAALLGAGCFPEALPVLRAPGGGGPFARGRPRPGGPAGLRCPPQRSSAWSVSAPGTVGRSPPPGGWAEPQAGGWTGGGLGWLRLRARSPRGLRRPVVCLFSPSARLLQSGLRQTEPSFWVRICLFNVDKTLLHYLSHFTDEGTEARGGQGLVDSLQLEWGSRQALCVCTPPS